VESYTETIRGQIDTKRTIVQIVDSYSPAGISHSPPSGFYYLVRLTKSAPLACIIDTSKYSTEVCGQLSFYPADLPYVITPKSKLNGFRTIRCRFYPEWFLPAANLPSSWNDGQLGQCFDLHNDRLERAVTWMGQEASSPGLASELIIESLSAIVAREVSQAFRIRRNELRVRTIDRKLPRSDYERIVEYISCFADTPLSVEDIARECGVSESFLYRSFKECAGMTIHKYVEQVRLSLAKDLLGCVDGIPDMHF
jgi:AraC family transcriptional regulator